MSQFDALETASLHVLVERIQQGDCAAQDELLNRVTSRLEPLASKMLRGFPGVKRFEETGDVLQAALMRLLAALKSVKPNNTRAFFGLAAEQIRRQLLDLNRHYQGALGAGRHLVKQPLVDPDQDGPQFPEPADSNLDSEPLVELERWAEFHRAVEQLPTEQREVVGLIFYHGWTQQQIAELLQISDRTVRRYWQSACLKINYIVGGRLPASDPFLISA